MELTQAERLILANQYLILAALYPHEAEAYEYKRENVLKGYELGYGNLEQSLRDETMSRDECQEVLDIMTMFSQLKAGYAKLADKAGVDQQFVEFEGFDANTELDQLLYAQHFCTQGRFQDLNVVNSHSENMDIYRSMLKAYKKLPRRPLLTKDDIIKITNAALQPVQ